jgi:hypothetical protein
MKIITIKLQSDIDVSELLDIINNEILHRIIDEIESYHEDVTILFNETTVEDK